MLKSFTQLFLLTFAMALASSVARADPIVITSGSLSVTGSFGAPVYSLTGANFSAVGSGYEFGATGPACLPCAPGDIINTSSNYVGMTLGRGIVTINGSTGRAQYSSSLANLGTNTVVLNGPQLTNAFGGSGSSSGWAFDAILAVKPQYYTPGVFSGITLTFTISAGPAFACI